MQGNYKFLKGVLCFALAGMMILPAGCKKNEGQDSSYYLDYEYYEEDSSMNKPVYIMRKRNPEANRGAVFKKTATRPEKVKLRVRHQKKTPKKNRKPTAIQRLKLLM